MENLTKEERDILFYDTLDESTKLIDYLEESQNRQKRYNIAILIITLLGAIGSIVAAVTGIFLLF